jgi:hypothetical protein
MAYDFLGLVNDVNTRLNEVQLTSSNFSTASGFYQQGKDAVNSAVRYINQSQYEWPFNHVEQEEDLSAGTTRYSLPSDCKTVDMDSFRIKRNATLGNDTIKLSVLSYEEYLDNYVDQEYNTSTGIRGVPQYVFQTPNFEYGVTPVPKEDYEIVYEYFRFPVDMISATDVPIIPERFRHVIIDGAMYYAYLFRSNSQDAVIMRDKFEDGIKQMRSMLVNRTEYVRSTAVRSSTLSTTLLGRL